MFEWFNRIWNKIPFRNWESLMSWYIRKYGGPDMLLIVLEGSNRHHIIGFIEVRHGEVYIRTADYRIRDTSSEICQPLEEVKIGDLIAAVDQAERLGFPASLPLPPPHLPL